MRMKGHKLGMLVMKEEITTDPRDIKANNRGILQITLCQGILMKLTMSLRKTAKAHSRNIT